MKIFISYSHKDAAAFGYLLAGMNPYIKSKQIQAWYDRYLLAGDVYDPIIKAKMEESDIIILLISFNFTISDYIFDNEIPIAVERFKKGARIIPIILEGSFAFLNSDKYFGSNINVLPRTPDENLFKPVSEWETQAWTIITDQLYRLIKNADLNNASPVNPQPNTAAMPVQNGKILNNPGQSIDTDIQHPSHPIKNILSTSYAVADTLLVAKNTEQEIPSPVDTEKNDLSNIFNVILRDEKDTDELQGQITKIRLENPDTAGIRKKCVVVGALTISLLRKYNRERVLMLMDFLEDKEPGLWERAVVGLVLSLSDRFDMLDMQVKRKLKALKNDQAIQETVTNLFYVLCFRNIKAEESLYRNREAFRNIIFFQDQANWFLPFTKEDIPAELLLKNEVFKYVIVLLF